MLLFFTLSHFRAKLAFEKQKLQMTQKHELKMQKAERRNIEALAELVEELNRYRSESAISDRESEKESDGKSGEGADDISGSSTLSFQTQVPLSFYAVDA